VSVLSFLFGLLAGASLLRQTVAALPSETAGALEHLQAYGEGYDVIVVGSSLTKLNFVPAVFDARMAEAGHPVRSFGFGLNGVRGGELHYYVERVLALRLPRLRWLVVDVSLDQDLLPQRDEGDSRRAIAWHAPLQTWLAIRHTLAQAKPGPVRAEAVAVHLRQLLLNRGNVGMGLDALRTAIWLDPPPKVKTRGALVAGAFLARGQEWKVKRYLATRSRHEAARRNVKYLRRTRAATAPGFYPQAERELARARGKSIAFLLSAMLFDTRFDPEVPGDEPLRVIDLNDPARYPELYAPDARVDGLHLTYAASVQYTQAIADSLAAQWGPRLTAAFSEPARP
jgi:hypothetical protein